MQGAGVKIQDVSSWNAETVKILTRRRVCYGEGLHASQNFDSCNCDAYLPVWAYYSITCVLSLMIVCSPRGDYNNFVLIMISKVSIIDLISLFLSANLIRVLRPPTVVVRSCSYRRRYFVCFFFDVTGDDFGSGGTRSRLPEMGFNNLCVCLFILSFLF